MTTITIVDDHSMVRLGIRAWLEAESDLRVVGEASRGEEAMQLLRNNPTSVLIQDLNLPDVDGLQMIKRVRSSFPQVRILVLTGHSSQWAHSALDAGASGYLLKDEGREAIVAAVRWAGETSDGVWISPTISKSLMHTSSELKLSDLTSTEIEVLKLLQNTNKSIAEKLFISEGTVRNYVSNIYSKLNVQSRFAAIEWARAHGL